MDRLSVAMAISRGRRLFHGQPFVVFALDLRDPLGACLAEILHRIGDAPKIEDLLLRAEQRERAPVMVMPASMEHVKLVVRYLDEQPELSAREGCTTGDLNAVRAFAHGARGGADAVPVFLAAEEERSVFRFPLHRRAMSGDPAHGAPSMLPIEPLLFGQLAGGRAANTNGDGEAGDLGILDDGEAPAGGPTSDA